MKKYLPIDVDQVNNKELRREYSRLRSIAKKRISRLEQTDYARVSGYRTVLGYLLPLKEFGAKDTMQLKRAYRETVKFLNASTSSIKGIKEDIKEKVADFHDRGYTFINEKNFIDFIEFMDFVRSYNASMGYEYVPEDAMNVFEEGHKRNLKADDIKNLFMRVMENGII